MIRGWQPSKHPRHSELVSRSSPAELLQCACGLSACTNIPNLCLRYIKKVSRFCQLLILPKISQVDGHTGQSNSCKAQQHQAKAVLQTSSRQAGYQYASSSFYTAYDSKPCYSHGHQAHAHHSKKSYSLVIWTKATDPKS